MEAIKKFFKREEAKKDGGPAPRKGSSKGVKDKVETKKASTPAADKGLLESLRDSIIGEDKEGQENGNSAKTRSKKHSDASGGGLGQDVEMGAADAANEAAEVIRFERFVPSKNYVGCGLFQTAHDNPNIPG